MISVQPHTANVPLLAALILGGTPLVLILLGKLIRRQFGSDLLAGISIVTSVFLGEYLAGTLVVLMLSGGEARKPTPFARLRPFWKHWPNECPPPRTARRERNIARRTADERGGRRHIAGHAARDLPGRRHGCRGARRDGRIVSDRRTV